MDNWKHRASNMRCQTCMYFVQKTPVDPPKIVADLDMDPEEVQKEISKADGFVFVKSDKVEYVHPKAVGRCRRSAPTMKGFPVVFGDDWCGDHKLDENKI